MRCCKLSVRKLSRCNDLKTSNYLPEIICLLLFTYCSSLWVISLKEDKSNNVQLSPLLELEKLIPRHEVQLLNANFSDQLHYDQLAQLQSEVEALVFEADVSEPSKQLLNDYKETSLSYTQLTSMLKTSQRLISDDSQFEDTQFMDVINDIRLKMFSFITTPSKTGKATLIELLNNVDTNANVDTIEARQTSLNVDSDDNQQGRLQHLKLVKLHSLFVLENYELTATYRKKLIGMPVSEAIFQERTLLQDQVEKTAIKKYTGIFGAILALIMLGTVVIKRNQSELKKTADMQELHKEFADSLLDMLGPNAVNVKQGATQGRKDKSEPMGIRQRR